MNSYVVTLEVSWVVEADTPELAQEAAFSVMEGHVDDWPFVTASPISVDELPT